MIDPRICDEFIDYWTEMNKSKTKMKFEMQETFDISRRLKRWIRNDFSSYTDNVVELTDEEIESQKMKHEAFKRAEAKLNVNAKA